MPKKNFIDNLLDRPIAFNPAYKRLTGSTNAALFVSQCWYWTKITTDPDGWFYKTRADWMEETGLTEDELDGARKISRGLGITEEKLKGVPATLYYRLNKEKLLSLLGFQFPEKQDTGLPETPQFPVKQESGSSVDFNKESETTALITTPEEKISFDEDKADLTWALLGGKKITQRQLDKQKAIKDFEDMLEFQFKRFPLNWIAFDEKAKDLFRRFLKDLPEGESLEGFVNWWMSDEKRVSTPPYTLAIVMQRWPQAFAGKHKQAPAEPKPLETPFTKNLETWEYYERPSFDQIMAAKKSSSEPLT